MFKGRILYDYPTNELRFNINSNATSRMVLTYTTLAVASDVRAHMFISNSGSLNFKGDIIQLKRDKLDADDRTNTNTDDHV